jgi:hypothetical protein
MIYSISRGKHTSRPFRFGLYVNKRDITYDVTFFDSCKYNLNSDDQYDTNKLFGIGYFPHHHSNSARYGWRYNPLTDLIELMAYCYDNGIRTITKICDCKVNEPYRLSIQIEAGRYVFIVGRGSMFIAQFPVPKSKNFKFGYKLGVYFGGNMTAPNDMAVMLNKTKA